MKSEKHQRARRKVTPVVRPLTPYAEGILRRIPFAPDDVPSWQIDSDPWAGRDVARTLQQLKKRGLIVVSPRRTNCGKRWQRPNAGNQGHDAPRRNA